MVFLVVSNFALALPTWCLEWCLRLNYFSSREFSLPTFVDVMRSRISTPGPLEAEVLLAVKGVIVL